LPKIYLLIGGSPFQSFSFAGKRKGMSTKCETEILTLEHYLQLKAEGYEFEGQSYLFWEYMRLLNECKPKYFLLENVEMGEKWERVLSKAIGINGIHINSALVSAQNRKRIYWTNIGHEPGGLFGDLVCKIEQPKDRGVLLKDILESKVDEKYYISSKMFDKINRTNNAEKCFNVNDKSLCLAAGYYKQGRDNQLITVNNTMPRSSTTGKGGTGPLSRNDGKTYCLDTGNTNAIEVIGCVKFGRTEEAKKIRKENMANGKDYTPFQSKEITGIDTDKMNTLTGAVNKDNLVFTKNFLQMPGYRIDNQVFYDDNKHGTLDCHPNRPKVLTNSRIRRLTPLECERLQTVKDNYTAHVSDSQRYKMLGNGWTVEVIAHIFSYIKQ
jgi:DNA (cytosine-5)-methyltransferase 3A